MHPATLPDVGVITKLYLAICVAFEEALTLNLARSIRRATYALFQNNVMLCLLEPERRLHCSHFNKHTWLQELSSRQKKQEKKKNETRLI